MPEISAIFVEKAAQLTGADLVGTASIDRSDRCPKQTGEAISMLSQPTGILPLSCHEGMP